MRQGVHARAVAYQRKWNGGHHDERREERTEPADHQDVDENQHSGEGEPEIAKDFDCNVPFAVPFQGGFCVGEGLGKRYRPR